MTLSPREHFRENPSTVRKSMEAPPCSREIRHALNAHGSRSNKGKNGDEDNQAVREKENARSRTGRMKLYAEMAATRGGKFDFCRTLGVKLPSGIN